MAVVIDVVQQLVRERDIEKAYADTMAGAAHNWMQRAQRAEQYIATLVHAAGGEIRVTDRDIYATPHLVLIKYEDKIHHDTVYRTGRKRD